MLYTGEDDTQGHTHMKTKKYVFFFDGSNVVNAFVDNGQEVKGNGARIEVMAFSPENAIKLATEKLTQQAGVC